MRYHSHKPSSMKQSMATLSQHRGFSDVLTYLMQLDDNTVLHKDGALSRYYRYQAPDLEVSTDEQVNAHADAWQHALGALGNGWMVETNMIAQQYGAYGEQRAFPEVVSAVFDDERRIQFKQGRYYKNAYYLTITWKPEQLLESRLRRFAIAGDNASKHGVLDRLVEQFTEKTDAWVSYLQQAAHIEPLQDDELTTLLHQCVTGKRSGLVTSRLGTFLDTYLAEEFVGGFYPHVAGRAVRVIAVDDLPDYSYPCVLDILNYFDVEYRWNSRYVFLDRMTTHAYLKKYQKNWSNKALGFLGILGVSQKLDADAQSMASQLDQSRVALKAGQLDYGFFNSQIVLFDEDEKRLDETVKFIAQAIERENFKTRVETVNAAEAYLGSLPGHGGYNLRKMLLDTRFVKHALPTSSLYQGEPTCPCPFYGDNQPPLLYASTTGNRPYSHNIHAGDVGHHLVVGPTGGGKTTYLATLMLSHRKYDGSRLIVFDKDRSNRATIRLLGGQYYDLEQGTYQFAPLARLEPEDYASIDKAVDWLGDICHIQGVDVTPKRRDALRDAVDRMAKEKAEYKNLNHLALQDSELREAINAFNRGRVKTLLNGTTPLSETADILGFDVSGLIQNHYQFRDTGVSILRAMLDEVEHLFRDRRPTLLILEEAWLYTRHPVFKERLLDWFKTLRKFNVAVIFVTQDLDDMVKSGALSLFQTSCQTRVFLPNASADTMAEAYQGFGLNAREIDIIRYAVPKKQYYYHSPQGSRLFELDLEEVAASLTTVSSKEDLAQLDALLNTASDERWLLDWLAYKGVSNEWQQYIQERYFNE